jgi:hypothetical protein
MFSHRNLNLDLNSINLKIDRREIELANLKSPSRQKLFKDQYSGEAVDFKFAEKNFMAQSEIYLMSLADL